jgi:hypothetical protein
MLRDRIPSEALTAWANYEPAEFKDGPLKQSNELRHAFTSGWLAAEQNEQHLNEQARLKGIPRVDVQPRWYACFGIDNRFLCFRYSEHEAQQSLNAGFTVYPLFLGTIPVERHR